MSICLKYVKGQKKNHNLNVRHYFNELTDPINSSLCLIKWLLIWALRTGAVQAKSWDQLKQDIAALGKVEWILPKYPVVCGSPRNMPNVLAYDTPASANVISQRMAKLGESTPGLGPIKTYDLRRGAAYEVATTVSESTQAGIAAGEAAAAEILGHTSATIARGVTKRYIGGSRSDHWSKRVAQQQIDTRPSQRAKVNDNPGTRPTLSIKGQRLSPKLVREACEKAHVDYNDKKKRRIVAEHLKSELAKQQKEAASRPSIAEKPPVVVEPNLTSLDLTWRNLKAIDRVVDEEILRNPDASIFSTFKTPSFNTVSSDLVVNNTTSSEVASLELIQHNLTIMDLSTVKQTLYNPDGSMFAMFKTSTATPSDLSTTSKQPLLHGNSSVYPVDPLLNGDFPIFTGSLSDLATRSKQPLLHGDSSVYPIEPLLDRDFSIFTGTASKPAAIQSSIDPSLESITDVPSGPWLADADTFVNFFAAINVYKYGVTNANLLPPGHVNGGSRDPASRFVQRCQNFPACNFSHASSSRISGHEKNCKKGGNGL